MDSTIVKYAGAHRSSSTIAARLDVTFNVWRAHFNGPLQEDVVRITDVHWTPVFVPFHRPELWVWSRRAGMTSIIIEVETDEGVIGLGECAAWPSYGLTIHVLESIRRLAVGEDALAPEPLWRRLYVLGGWRHASPAGNPALSGFEVALWDIMGKAAGLPLFVLIGGAVRAAYVECSYLVMRGNVAEVAEEAAAAIASGFRTLYLKRSGWAPKTTSRLSKPYGRRLAPQPPSASIRTRAGHSRQLARCSTVTQSLT